MQTVSTQLQTHDATRQSTNFVYRNADEEVTLEWITDSPDQVDGPATVLVLADIALTHKSSIPASLASFRQVTK